jgi:transposase
VGVIPAEKSSGKKRRLGELTKQGNAMLRHLWCEAAGHAVRRDAELKRFYTRKLAQKGFGKATVAAGRKLASGCGSCCAMRLFMTSSAVADGSAGKPMRRSLPDNVVQRKQ